MKYRSQSDRITIADSSEIVIREFNNKCTNLVSSGTFHQVHPVDLLTRRVINDGRPSQIYTRATSHVRPKPTLENLTRITAAGNRYQTTDISNDYLHLPSVELPFVERQSIGQANYSRNFCHTHGQQVSHNANQCRSEDVRRWSR